MTELPAIRLLPASPDGRLQASYVADSSVLVFESLTSVEGVHVVNIDNAVILDALDDGRVVAVEVMYDRSQWNVVQGLDRPQPDRLADIALDQDWLLREWVELPIVAETNKTRDHVLIRLTADQAPGTWIELSTNCLAAVAEGRLLAFFADISG